MRDLVLAGAVLGAHGIRGEVKLRSFTAEPEAIGAYKPLLAADGRQFEIARLRLASSDFIVSFKGIIDRNAAEALRGLQLFVPRAALPKAGEDEVYVHDLVGLVAIRPDGAKLGEITSVENYGAGDLLEIAIDGRKDRVLVPFADPYVTELDIGGGLLTIDLPADYLDEPEQPDDALKE